MASKVTTKDNGWKSLKRTLAKIPSHELLIGIPGEIDFDVPTQGAIGAVHEFGSIDGSIPERSFLRSTFDANVTTYTRSLAQRIRRSIERGAPMQSALFQLGEKVREDVINRIRKKEIKQDLSPVTLKAKAPKTTALINSGSLVGSIVSVVRPR